MALQRRSRSPEIPDYDDVDSDTRSYYLSCIAEASKRLPILLKLLRSLHRFTHHSNWMALGDATKDELAAYHAAACSIINQIRRIRADVEEQIVEHEAPSCNQLLQEFWDFFSGTGEIRNLMYGFIFEDSALSLIVEEREYFGFAVRSYVGAKAGTRIPYRYLLEPDYFINNAEIRKEMAYMWFRTSKFGLQDPSTIASSLLQFPWSAGLKPLTILSHVLVVAYTRYEPDDEPDELERSLKPLLLLNTTAAITIYVENLIHYPDFEDAEVVVSMRTCAQRAAYLFPELVELRSRGYKVTVRSEFGLEFLVESEETTVEGWTKICEAAVEEARIKLWKAEYSEDFGDWDKMEEASQKYISDSSQHYYSDDPQEEDSDESHEDGSDGSQEDESDGSQEDESDGSQEDESDESQEDESDESQEDDSDESQDWYLEQPRET